MTEIICAGLSAVALVAVAIINKRDKESKRRTEERAKIREKESRLSMAMMCSTSELCHVVSLAVTGGHTNGNVEAAQVKAAQDREAYNQFIRETAAHSVTNY